LEKLLDLQANASTPIDAGTLRIILCDTLGAATVDEAPDGDSRGR
jgi:hypothetical protein